MNPRRVHLSESGKRFLGMKSGYVRRSEPFGADKVEQFGKNASQQS
jgi:hypothetical protein